MEASYRTVFRSLDVDLTFDSWSAYKVNSNGLLVVVPAFNEEASIVRVVSSIKQNVDAAVVVVDDGSSDSTKKLAIEAGATVLAHPFNVGVGGAIRTALKYAEQHQYAQVVQLDGDGQHDPLEVSTLLEPLSDGTVDLVIGGRFNRGYDMGLTRRLAMRALSKIVSKRIGREIIDVTSGFRGMGPRAIAFFARSYPVDYLNDTVEALLLAGDAKLRICEVDVKMQHRMSGKSSASPLRSGYHFGRLLLGLVLRRVGKEPQLLPR